MNPGLRERIARGAFARVTLDEDTLFTGYIGTDPGTPGQFRMDGCVLGPSGHLEQISLHISPEDIHHIHFLPEAPEFVDREGHVFTMEPGFFRHLD
jgi:hypothetical protein